MTTTVSLQVKTETSRVRGEQRRQSLTGLTFDMSRLKENLALAEMKAAAASKEIEHTLRKLSNGSESGYVPPKQLLLYLVRMGSFTSKPKLSAAVDPDSEIQFSPVSCAELLTRCTQELGDAPPPLPRHWRCKQDNVDECDDTVRVLQWNHLSQTLGTNGDSFKCDPEALNWTSRRWRILQELLRHDPDIICLQEVDHFDFLNRALGSVGYVGKFVPKPDSPCLYMEDNTGPDGCALFFKGERFSLLSWHWRVLQVWRVESNQVVMAAMLRDQLTGADLCVVTTHLKAKKGALLSTLRSEQGQDILSWLTPLLTPDTPLIITGDFNAQPGEPVISHMTSQDKLPLTSCYDLETLDWTTWKIRDTGEEKYVLDYMFTSNNNLETVRVLETPSDDDVDSLRLPSLSFPSDHLSLVADIKIINQ